MQLLDPDDDVETIDQLFDVDQTTQLWGNLPVPSRAGRLTKAIARSYIDTRHIGVPAGTPAGGLQQIAEFSQDFPTIWAAIAPWWFDGVCATTGPPANTVPNWNVFRHFLDDFGGQEDNCGYWPPCPDPAPDPAVPPWSMTDFAFDDSYRAERIMIDPSGAGAHGFVPRGQDFSTAATQQVDPIYYWDLSNGTARDAWIARAVARVSHWERPCYVYPCGVNPGCNQEYLCVPTPCTTHPYGSSQIDFASFAEEKLHGPEWFQGDPPRYVLDLHEPQLYFNSPTFSAFARVDYEAFTGHTRFPVLPADFYQNNMGALAEQLDPTNPTFATRMDEWMRWRYHVFGKFAAEAAADMKAATGNNRTSQLGFMIFYPPQWYPRNRTYRALDPSHPRDRRWYLTPGEENVFPALATGSKCRQTIYVDTGIDPVEIDKEFRAHAGRPELEWAVVEEGNTAAENKQGIDQLQQAANDINRDRGYADGASRIGRLKTAHLFNFYNGTIYDQTYLMAKGIVPAPVTCEPPYPYDLSRPRAGLAQLKNAGMDGVHTFPGSFVLDPCDEYKKTRTPYFHFLRAAVRTLTDEEVFPRTINANRAPNGSFESFESDPAVGGAYVADSWSTGSPSLVSLVTPALDATSGNAYQGDRYVKLAAPGGSSLTVASDFVVLEPTRTYKCQAYVRRTGGAGEATLRLQRFDRYGAPTTGVQSSTSGLGTTWTKLEIPGSITVPQDTFAQILVAASAGAEIDVDNVWLHDDTGAVNLDAPNYIENPSMELTVPGTTDPQAWKPEVKYGTPTFGLVTLPAGAAAYQGGTFPSPLASFLRIALPASGDHTGTWISDVIFADIGETYTDLGVLVRVTGATGSARAELRWYKEGHDGDEYLSKVDVGLPVTAGGWVKRELRFSPATCIASPASCLKPPEEAVFARIYLIAEGAGINADFDAAILHGLGPRDTSNPFFMSFNPCTGGVPDPPGPVDFTMAPVTGALPLIVETRNLTQGGARIYEWKVTSPPPSSCLFESSGGPEPKFLLSNRSVPYPSCAGGPGQWRVEMRACATPGICSGWVTRYVDTTAPAPPTLADVAGRAADPRTFEPLDVTGTGFTGPDVPTKVVFSRTVPSMPRIVAAGSNVDSSTHILATSPLIDATSPEDTASGQSKVWVENPYPLLGGTPTVELDFTFTYRPQISSIPGTIGLGETISIVGESFIEDLAADGAEVVFRQGSTVVTQDALLGECPGAAGNRCPDAGNVVTVVVPPQMSPGAGFVSVRKKWSFGLPDGRVTPEQAVTFVDSTPPQLVDTYPPKVPLPDVFDGAAVNTDTVATVGDAGSLVDRSALDLSVAPPACGICPAETAFPAASQATSFTLRRPAGGTWAYDASVSATASGTGFSHQWPFKTTTSTDGELPSGDGMKDRWESEHFVTSTRFSGSADPDRDLKTNSTEHGAGTNPDSLYRMVAAPGPRPSNDSRILLYSRDGGRALLWSGSKEDPAAGFVANDNGLGIFYYGANVAAADVDADGFHEIVTGAGPDPASPDVVKGFDIDGTWKGWSFSPYGLTAYGSRVAGADLYGQSATRDEILTAPGPGAAFGPQVRGFYYNGLGSTYSAMSKVNFMAFGGGYGAHVDAGDLNGDGYDDIVAGMGPGPSYVPTVRGFRYDGTVTQVLEIAAAYGANQGVRVAVGDLDAATEHPALHEEIVTAPGPGVSFGPDLKAWNWDNSGQSPALLASAQAYTPYGSFGAHVASGGDLDRAGDGFGDEIAVTPSAPLAAGIGQATDRVYGSRVRLFRHDGSATLAPLGPGFMAFDTQGYTGGAQIAFGVFDDVTVFTPLGGAFTDSGGTAPVRPRADAALGSVGAMVSSLPDGTEGDGRAAVWMSPETKAWAAEAVASLAMDLGRLPGPDVSRRLGAIRGHLAASVTSPGHLAALLEQIDAMDERFSSGELPLGATVARHDLSGAGACDALARGRLATDRLIAMAVGSPAIHTLSPSGAWSLSEQVEPAGTLVAGRAVALASTGTDATADGMLVVTVEERVEGGARLGDLVGYLRHESGTSRRVLATFRQDEGAAGSPFTLLAAAVSPGIAKAPLVHVAGTTGGKAQVAHPGQGVVVAIALAGDLAAADVEVWEQTAAGGPLPRYTGLSGTSAGMLSVHAGGVDLIGESPGDVARAVDAGGTSMDAWSHETGAGVAVLDPSAGTLTLASLPGGQIVAKVGVPRDASAVAAAPGGGVAVVTGASVAVVDLEAARVERELPMPGRTGAVLVSEEGSLAYVSEEGACRVWAIALGPALPSGDLLAAGRALSRLPDAALAAPAAASRQCIVDALGAAMARVAHAESLPEGASREAAASAAIDDIRRGVLARMDGGRHGDPSDDCIVSAAAQQVVGDLALAACDGLEALR